MHGYNDLSPDDQVMVAAEFVARGAKVPLSLRSALGDTLTDLIEHPTGASNGTEDTVGVSTAYAG